MALKTLAELEQTTDGQPDGIAYIEALKQSAIKDVKEYKRVIKDVPSRTKDLVFYGIVDYIKWKFNLTEEELSQ